METSTTPTTTAKRVKTADQPLVGEVIAHIGALIWNEKPESTCFISKQAFKAAIEEVGGKVGPQPTRNTTMVVRGNAGKCVDPESVAKFDAASNTQLNDPKRTQNGTPLKLTSFYQFVSGNKAVQDAVKRRLTTVRFPLRVHDKKAYDATTGEYGTKPNPSYKAPAERTEKVLQMANTHQCKAEAAAERFWCE